MSINHRFQVQEPRHPIQVVSRRTGLSADVIRAWERRHNAVAPERSPTSRRLYSDAEVERLSLLRRATLNGRRIGDIAHLSSPELRALVDADEAATSRVPQPPRQAAESPVAQTQLAACLEALRGMDALRLEQALSTAAMTLSTPLLIERVLAPLMRKVGDLWRDGLLGIGHEHLATVLVGSLLGSLRAAYSKPGAGPEIVVTTPTGQHHELGALMAAVIAAAAGWRVSYLGSNMPAEEIAAAAATRQAKAVALSIVFPEDDPALGDELRRLRRGLTSATALLVGGPAVRAYEAAIRDVGATVVADMTSLGSELDGLR